MNALVIKDLSMIEDLDRAAMSAVRGGRTVTMFLRRVWRDGALFGSTSAESAGDDQSGTPTYPTGTDDAR
jgi:hypothetical protein